MKKIVLISETVTYAHLVRLYTVAQNLKDDFKIIFVHSQNYKLKDYEKDKQIQVVVINSISTNYFNKCLRNGKAFFSASILAKNIKTDLNLIKEFQPDFIIGDFRISLSYSTKIAEIPYVNLTNYHWSSDYKSLPVIPDNPLPKLVGMKIANQVGKAVLNLIMSRHLKHYNTQAKKHNMPAYKNFKEVYSDGDFVFFDDCKTLYNANARNNEAFIGPILPVFKNPLPPWWNKWDKTKPVIFINIGSSGSLWKILQTIHLLGQMPYQFLIAKSYRNLAVQQTVNNLFIADFIPGEIVAQKADVVITNGGGPSSYQALKEGRPLICVPSNLDQHLVSQALEKNNLCKIIRSELVSAKKIEEAIVAILSDPKYKENSEKIGVEIRSNDFKQNLLEALKKFNLL